MFNLPPHLQTLNSISTSPPSSALTQQEEEAFWGFMHTDNFFSNFGVAPSELEDKKVEQVDLSQSQSQAQAQPQTEQTQQLQQQQPQQSQQQQQYSGFVADTPLPYNNTNNTAAPTPSEARDNSSASTSTSSTPLSATTLESFLAAFANDPNQLLASTPNPAFNNDPTSNYLLNLPTPYSTAATPSGINTADLLASYAATAAAASVSASASAESPYDFSTEEGRISGAKKLKQVGAGQAEIEEDKRRRNTEASARFRQKKKEREQAVEKRAKDLEAQVAQLSNEKASLENENRLLKAIVLNGSEGQKDALQSALSAFGKRKRE